MESYSFRSHSRCPKGHPGVLVHADCEGVTENQEEALKQEAIGRIVAKLFRESDSLFSSVFEAGTFTIIVRDYAPGGTRAPLSTEQQIELIALKVKAGEMTEEAAIERLQAALAK